MKKLLQKSILDSLKGTKRIMFVCVCVCGGGAVRTCVCYNDNFVYVLIRDKGMAGACNIRHIFHAHFLSSHYCIICIQLQWNY